MAPAEHLHLLETLLDDCWQGDRSRFARKLGRLRDRAAKGEVIADALRRMDGELQRSRARVERRQGLALRLALAPDLPVTQRAEDIREAIANHQVVVVAGETGSGKTTQLPKICLALGRGLNANIGHTQPRRLAARTVARRLAQELDTAVGQGVGYQVRFEQNLSECSRVLVMTDGILLTAIAQDPELRAFDTLIIDEAHERSLNIDFLLGYLRKLLPRRPDLKLIITSATIDVERFSSHFQGAPVIEVSGRSYPVELRYRPRNELSVDNDLGEAVAAALGELVAEGCHRQGDVLVFLSGEREIREVARHLRDSGLPQAEVLPLYARLGNAEQERIFNLDRRRGWRIVLATNVAETSLTVPGIRYVVDAGTARISRYSYRSKVQRLPIEPISQASANQRAGRCGRVAPGIAIRLYEEQDFQARSEFTEPEIQRTNLAAVILQMLSMRLGDVSRFPFVDPPDRRLISDGYKLLEMLGAVSGQKLTEVGRTLARFPVDPRLGRMLMAAQAQGCLNEALIIVSALSIQDPRERPADKRQAADEMHRRFWHPDSDFLSFVNLWNYVEEQRQLLSRKQWSKACQREFLSVSRLMEWREVHRQLRVLCRQLGWRVNTDPADYSALHKALLSGLLDQIAMLGEPPEYLGTRNRKLLIFPGSALQRKKPKWLVAAEVAETSRLYARGVARIEPDWLLGINPSLLKRSFHEPHWQTRSGRVMAYEKTSLFGLVIRERKRVHYGPIDAKVSREILIQSALVEGRYRGGAAFFQHNQQLIEQVLRLEAKWRRRDILVSDEKLYGFYDQRIPEGITTTSRLDSWLSSLPPERRKLLHMSPEHVSLLDDALRAARDYPDELICAGLRLPLCYHFEPGHVADGVTAEIPVVLLNRLPAHRFEWLVPGMLRAKCIALLKSLPKQWRKQLVPAPETVDAALALMEAGDVPLIPAFTRALKAVRGVQVPAENWDIDRVDDCYRMNFRIVSAAGEPLAEGRELKELRLRFREQMEESLSAETAQQFQEQRAIDWQFGDLPREYDFKQGGASVRSFPALVDQGDAVALQLMDSATAADSASRAGVIRLLLIRLGQPVKTLRAEALHSNSVQLQLAATGQQRSEWLEGLLQLSAERCFLHGEPLPRSRDDFDKLWQRGKSDFGEQADATEKLLTLILERFSGVRRSLKTFTELSWIETVSDIRQQLQLLVYPGFLTAEGLDRLLHYPRYLEALQQRLDKLRGNQSRDLKLTRMLGALQQPLLERMQGSPGSLLESAALRDYRWMLEELRVSLFAQELGTPIPVSEKRLRLQWQQVLDEQAPRA